jgi:hypothetical protein
MKLEVLESLMMECQKNQRMRKPKPKQGDECSYTNLLYW